MRKLTRLSTALLASCLAIAGVSQRAEAAVPTFTVVEGFLNSAGGGPAADGNYAVVFSIYKDELGGNPVYTEGPVTIGVKNGQWSHQLGSKVALTPTALAGLSTAWLGIKVESDAELPRKPLSSVAFSLRAAVAEGLECSGCIGAGHLDAKVLEPYAKTASLSKVALSGKFEDLSGGPDLSAYTKTAGLAKVALSGAYADLSGVPDLSVFAKVASLHKVAGTGSFNDLVDLPTMATVATSGEYKDLKNAPVVPAVGKSCGTGLVVKGLKADGSLECVQAMDPSALPADGIDEISNGLIANQFTDTAAGKANIGIPDNNPLGIGDTIDFPDIGIAQKLTVTVDITNSDISKLKVFLYDPNNTEYILYSEGSTGGSLVTSYPDPTTPVKGDLTAWVGKNPQGKWSLKVIDTAFKNNATDGAINKWSINLQTLSSKKVQVKGNLIVDGDITAASINGGAFSMFPPGSAPFLYGNIEDHCSGNWVYTPAHQYASNIALDNASLHAVATHVVFGDKNGNWHQGIGGINYANQYEDYTRQYLVAFLKNTTTSDITRQICFRWSSNPWGNGNYTSLALNGSNVWSYTSNNLSSDCVNVTFPKSKTSVLALKTGTYMWTQWNGFYNKSIIGFYNNSFNLAGSGLEFDYQRYQDWVANK